MSVFAAFPALRRAGLLVLSVAVVGLSACKDDDDDHPTPTSQPVSLEFEHLGSDGQPLVYGRPYTTAAGAPYAIDSLKYYVSNVQLTRTDGTVWVAPAAYYLIRATSAPADNVELEIPAVPLGSYSKVTFSVGVDSVRNHTGDQPGVLAPRYGMLWTWATGYKFLVLNGRYLPAAAPAAELMYHLGGDAVYRPMTVTLDLPTTATVTGTIAPAAHLAVDVNALFGGPNRADLTDSTQLEVMGANARIAANVRGMFSVEHVHNEPHAH